MPDTKPANVNTTPTRYWSAAIAPTANTNININIIPKYIVIFLSIVFFPLLIINIRPYYHTKYQKSSEKYEKKAKKSVIFIDLFLFCSTFLCKKLRKL